MDVRVGLQRKLSTEELMLLNCSVGEDSSESLGCKVRSTQSILKEISPGCSLEGLMLKLKLQYFGHLMWRVDSFEKTLMLRNIKGSGERDDTGWDDWMTSPTQWTWVWRDSGSWWWTGRPGVLQSMGLQRVGHNWVTKLNWSPFPLSHSLQTHSLHTHVSSLLLFNSVQFFFPVYLLRLHMAQIHTAFLVKWLIFSVQPLWTLIQFHERIWLVPSP